jgi:LmbE family N-acetylglucosaminyl deacetylase
MSLLVRRTHLVCSLAFIASLGLLSFVAIRKSPAESRPLAQDTGTAGLEQMLRKLRTTARLMHTTAHPDDEDGGMLALEARGAGASVLLLTLNRGEGGQNKTGSELFDELGVLRTLELLTADQYYGVAQRFTRVVDFGFSKDVAESFQKWQGHDIALADMVRAIRVFRPDVVVARFQGAWRDGHGNHQVAGILTPEAFRAAADPQSFPEQLKEGLAPWQVKKLYTDNVRPNEDYTLRLDTGAYDPALGMSYAQFALEGLGHQLSQGSGGYRLPPGHSFSYYKLVESLVPTKGSKGEHEQSFFDGIDTTLPGLADRLGEEEGKVPFLRAALRELEGKVDDAAAAFAPPDPSRPAAPLLAGLNILNDLITRVGNSSLSPAAKADLSVHLRSKHQQFETAANLALGIVLEVAVDAPSSEVNAPAGFPQLERTLLMAVPGETFTLTARLYNRSRQTVTPKEIAVDLPAGWRAEALKQDLKPLGPDDEASEQFQVIIPTDAAYTRPYWRRHDTQEAVYTIDEPQDLGMPLPPRPVQAHASYSLGGATGEIHSTAEVKYIDPLYGQEERPLVVGPPLSVEVKPSLRVMATSQEKPAEVAVAVRNNVTGPVSAKLRLEVPAGWRAVPDAQPVSFARDGEYSSFKFQVLPGSLREGSYEIRAVADYNGKPYAEGYDVVTRHDLGTFYYYQPATQRVNAVQVKLPAKLKVGYIMGAGDSIASVLQQLGMDVEAVGPAELEGGNLSRFDTIILGIRAYDVRRDMHENNRRLLDYVAGGGTLVVQYNQDTAAFNAGHYTPYPATASTARVSVEEAPVEVLAPQDSVFHYPNEISARDFDGWIQERGLYFMSQWDKRFEPLLSSHDPGEPALAGGLLRARFGKGIYICTGYAFFRQVPAGVPGAIRLFVNIISSGNNKK